MPRKLIPSFRKEATTTLLAALTMPQRHIPSPIHRFVSESEVAKPFRVGLFKRQVRAFGEIKPVERGTDTVRIGEGVLDRQTHIRHTELRFHRPVFKLHHRVNHGLRMHHDFNLAGLNAKQPLRLDNLKTFVHHRSGVDGNLGPHLPVGVFQGLRLGHHGLKLLQRAGTERSPEAVSMTFLYRIADFSCQTLKNSGMFESTGKNRCTVLLCQFIKSVLPPRPTFLYSPMQWLCPNRIHGRFQSGVADHRRQYHINRPGLHYLADGVIPRVYLYRQVAQSFFQFGIFLSVGYHDNFRLKLPAP